MVRGNTIIRVIAGGAGRGGSLWGPVRGRGLRRGLCGRVGRGRAAHDLRGLHHEQPLLTPRLLLDYVIPSWSTSTTKKYFY